MLGRRMLANSACLRLAASVNGRKADWVRAFRVSRIGLQLVTEKLPSLGDSITEGTLNSWSKRIGEKVAVDDVVAVIETDKVSVDLRVPVAGVLTKQMAAEGDTVQVGAELYVIDTEGQATAATNAVSTSPPAASVVSQATQQPQRQQPKAPHHTRTPLIKFLGKRSLLQQKPHGQKQQPAVQQATKVITHSPNAIEFTELPGGALYGRPELTQVEIEYIESGGASMWG